MVVSLLNQDSFNELLKTCIFIRFNPPSEIPFLVVFVYFNSTFIPNEIFKVFPITSNKNFGGVGSTVNKYTNFGKASVSKTFILPIKDNLNLLYKFKILSTSLIFCQNLIESFFLVLHEK